MSKAEQDAAYYARNRSRIREQQRQRYQDNRESEIARARSHAEKNRIGRALIDRRARLKSYGLTEAEYERMWVEQLGVCAICHRPDPTHQNLVVDHDHETGLVRGLLCHPCNTALGIVRDDPEHLTRMVSYLEGDTNAASD